MLKIKLQEDLEIVRFALGHLSVQRTIDDCSKYFTKNADDGSSYNNSFFYRVRTPRWKIYFVFVRLSSSFVHLPTVLRVTQNERKPFVLFYSAHLVLVALLINSTSPRVPTVYDAYVCTYSSKGFSTRQLHIFFSFSFPPHEIPYTPDVKSRFFCVSRAQQPCATVLDSFTATEILAADYPGVKHSSSHSVF